MERAWWGRGHVVVRAGEYCWRIFGEMKDDVQLVRGQRTLEFSVLHHLSKENEGQTTHN